MTLAILILAAGQSSRMRGADKLLEHVTGIPLLSLMAERALSTGLMVAATVPALTHSRALALPAEAQIVDVPDADKGMSASIRAGVMALSDAIDAVMILPADMPEITAQDLSLLAGNYRGGILRATSQDGTPGHPVVFPSSLFDELCNLSGDTGARGVIAAHKDQLHYFALPENHALVDLDTPEAWQQWNSRNTD